MKGPASYFTRYSNRVVIAHWNERRDAVLEPVSLSPGTEKVEAGGLEWSISTSLIFPLVRIYQVYLNYRIDERLFLHPAPGIAVGIFQANPPPNFGDEIESSIFVPQLLVGVRF